MVQLNITTGVTNSFLVCTETQSKS